MIRSGSSSTRGARRRTRWAAASSSSSTTASAAPTRTGTLRRRSIPRSCSARSSARRPVSVRPAVSTAPTISPNRVSVSAPLKRFFFFRFSVVAVGWRCLTPRRRRIAVADEPDVRPSGQGRQQGGDAQRGRHVPQVPRQPLRARPQGRQVSLLQRHRHGDGRSSFLFWFPS